MVKIICIKDIALESIFYNIIIYIIRNTYNYDYK